MPVLAVLRHEEAVRLNTDPLVSLYCDLGQDGAERVLFKAMDELCARLSDIARQDAGCDAAALIQSVRVLGKVAEQIGMAMLSRVAGDVVRTIQSGDMTARAATLSRLIRIGERSLNAVWDLRERAP